MAWAVKIHLHQMSCVYFWARYPLILKKADDQETGVAVIIECNIDDMNPELYDALMERLFAAGRA